MRITRPRATKASQITWDLTAALVASLESGGVNEINVAGLSGALADNQPFDESRIENGGAQEISVAGLSGLLSDTQHGFFSSGAKIWDATAAPALYTDLDLSAYCGSVSALVILKVEGVSGGPSNIAFRPNGDTKNYTEAGSYSNTNFNFTVNGQTILLLCSTDGAGILEWGGSVAAIVNIWLLGWVRA